MLRITIPSIEWFNEETQEFGSTNEQTLTLEHSLVSLSKWESKWQKPFFSDQEKTTEETVDYIKCMTITQNIKDEVYNRITNENIKEVNDYIKNPMSATTIGRTPGKINRDVITAEIIYYWMIAFNIPFECQKWHLNKLLTLIQVCNIKNSPSKRMSKKDVMSRNAALNAARKKAHNTKG